MPRPPDRLRPRALSQRLLSLVIDDPEKRECLLGDLHEDRSEIAAARGRVGAALWFWAALVRVIVRCGWERIRTGGRTRSTGRGGRGVMETIIRDVRLAARHWARSPGFTTAAALTVALGIGATTTVFSVADAVLARTPTGVRDPRSLVGVRLFDSGQQARTLFSYPVFQEYRDAANGLEAVSVLDLFTATIGAGRGSEPQAVSGMVVSADYFSILGTRLQAGRFFLPDEDVPGQPVPVVVLSYGYWVRKMGADPEVVGRTVTINRTAFTVVGIAEEGFRGHLAAYDFSIWIPVAAAPAVSDIDPTSPDVHRFALIGRIASGASLERVQAAAEVVTERIRAAHPGELAHLSIVPEPYQKVFEEIRGPITLLTALFSALAGIVLLIASVNVGGMLLARASGRTREMGIRLALGAGRATLLRQLLTESVILFLVGGGAGALLAYWATRSIGALNLPTPVPVVIDAPLDGRALLFTLCCALLSGAAFGLAPAVQATTPDIRGALVGDAVVPSIRGGRLRSALVVLQVAGSVVLLAVAGVLARGLGKAGEVDLGFDPTGVHVVGFDLSLLRYSDAEAQVFVEEASRRAAALPGVEHVAIAGMLPLGSSSMSTIVEVPGRDSSSGQGGVATDVDFVTADFFRTLAIPTTTGRSFNAGEAREGGAIVVNETASRRLWPEGSPVGKSVRLLDREMTVVGVVPDGKYRSLGEAPRPMVYAPPRRANSGEVFLLTRTVPGASLRPGALRGILHDLDPDLPIQTDAAFARIIGTSLLPNRVAAGVAASFGGAALLLATMGLYGVLSYTVGRRTREVGIRMALGADISRLRSAVLLDGVRLVGVGLLVGIPVALLLTWSLRAMLYGLSPADPGTYVTCVVALTATGVVASILPARRATRVDPVCALRSE